MLEVLSPVTSVVCRPNQAVASSCFLGYDSGSTLPITSSEKTGIERFCPERPASVGMLRHPTTQECHGRKLFPLARILVIAWKGTPGDQERAAPEQHNSRGKRCSRPSMFLQ